VHASVQPGKGDDREIAGEKSANNAASKKKRFGKKCTRNLIKKGKVLNGIIKQS
jgi:hypothetical protein